MSDSTLSTSAGSKERYVAGQTRSRPLQVICPGLPRSGTRSIATALERLGYTHCAHGFDILGNDAYAARLEQAVDAKYFDKGRPFERDDWDELLGHCSAVTDAPLAFFWRELCDAYPDAKMVLVERDIDKWYKSFKEGVIDAMHSPAGRLTRKYVEPVLGSRVGPMSFKSLQGFLGVESAEGMEQNAKTACREHYEEVRATISPDRLLDYKLGTGWKPLCDFLDKPIPDEDFPWVNESEALQVVVEDFKKQKQDEFGKVIVNRVLPVGVAIVMGIVALRYAST